MAEGGPRLTPAEFGRAVAHRIWARMDAEGLSRQGLADLSGISRTTLERKLGAGPADRRALGEKFTVDELARIADVLDVPFEALSHGVEPAAVLA